jgi:mono/diheme cytochrome c family protein
MGRWQHAAIALIAGFFLACEHAHAGNRPGPCPQPRFTEKAPPDYYFRPNPLEKPSAADYAAAEALYKGDGRKRSCASCHGENGDGQGPLSSQFDPPPRDFQCAKTINGTPDGHLFWIIRFGSPGTSMPGHKHLLDNQIWQLVWYLRHLAK